MKTILPISLIVFLLTGCYYGFNMNEIRKEIADSLDAHNAKTVKWDSFLDSLYRLADTNKISCLKTINEVNYGPLDDFQASELHFLKGLIYYRLDSLHEAIKEYSVAGMVVNMDDPMALEARAGAYIKLKEFETALYDLRRAAALSSEFNWSIGNYYEIRGQKDSAIAYYDKLYHQDTVKYKMCKSRMDELGKKKPALLTDLAYHARTGDIIMLKGIRY